jgi:hypothetical protein
MLPALVALLAEAAWISVVAGVLQAFASRDPSPGIPALLLVALAGTAAARVLGARLGRRWPLAAVGLAVTAGALTWLAAPEVRSILGARGIAGLDAALAAHPGGWLAAVAVARGFAHARQPPDPDTIGNLLGLGVPGLALAVIIGGMTAEPWRGRFLDQAQAAVLVFVVAGLLALALNRLTLVDARPGLDWRRNPAWVGLLVLLLLAVAAVALSVSLVAGPTIVALVGAAITLLVVVGVFVGFDRWSLRMLGIAVATLAVLAVVAALLRGADVTPTGPSEETVPPITEVLGIEVPAPLAIALVILLLLLAFVILYAFARLWMARTSAVPDELLETRWIDHGDTTEHPRGGRRRLGTRFRRPAPGDAVAAYRALIEALAPRPRVRREPGETPAEHAARLRRSGMGALSLDLLAADYGLVRYGGVSLSGTEQRRAIARATQLRRRLTSTPDRPGDAGTPGNGPDPGSRSPAG